MREQGKYDQPAPAPGTKRRPQNTIAQPQSERRQNPPDHGPKTPAPTSGSGQGKGSLGQNPIRGGKAGPKQGVPKTAAPVKGSSAPKNANVGKLSGSEKSTRRAVRKP